MNAQPFRNAIRQSIEAGSFLYTLEYVPDVRDGTGRKGIDHLEREAELVGRDPRISGVNIGDRVSRLDTLDTVECGAIAAKASGKMPLLHLAGKDRKPEEAIRVLQRAHSLGLTNYLLITGDRVIKPPNEERTRYHELVIAIQDAKKIDPGCLAAAVVSPFKYREEELANQYLKMVKKINAGANYLVTNCGWDMQKFQELIWYRDARGLSVPILANLLVPPLGWAKSINAGRLPGVHLSNDLLEIIVGESKLGKTEFERLSVRRLALQIVGLKLMGYAGVHLSGIETHELLRHTIEVADELEQKLPTSADWKAAWTEAHPLPDRRPATFGPPNGLYLFGDERPLPASFNEFPTIVGVTASEQELRKTRVLDTIDRALFDDDSVGAAVLKPVFSALNRNPLGARALLKLEKAIKQPMLGCETCGFCRIPYVEYICPETCPKGLANGPCSGTDDNVCEFKDRECIHNRKYRIAKATNRLSDLETLVIPAVTGTRMTSSWVNKYQHLTPAVLRISDAKQADPKSLTRANTTDGATVSTAIAAVGAHVSSDEVD